MVANTELISEFTRKHACRALLIAVVRNAPEKRSLRVDQCPLPPQPRRGQANLLRADLLSPRGRDQGTPHQYRLRQSRLRSAALFLVAGRYLRKSESAPLGWIDRLIVDSLAGAIRRRNLPGSKSSLAETKARLALRDLNWTRSLALRQAISKIFDSPEKLPHLAPSAGLITHAPENRSTALLLAGWLAGQLGWKLKSESPIVFTASRRRNRAHSGKRSRRHLEQDHPRVRGRPVFGRARSQLARTARRAFPRKRPRVSSSLSGRIG